MADHRPGAAISVTVRYFAAARSAAGVTQEQLATRAADGGDRCTVADVVQLAIDLHGPSLAQVMARCSFLLDEIAVHGRDTAVRDGQVLDVLPPFAGG